MQNPIERSINNLSQHMRSEAYKGYDPYDTLLAPIFKWPIFNTRFVRFGAQQVCKRIPFSLRTPLRIPKGLNPVTLGLSIQGYSYLIKALPEQEDEFIKEINRLLESLERLQSKGYSGSCWGYDFDWEARYTRIMAYVPTSVATGDITNGLMECYLLTGNSRALELVKDATHFILNDLNKSFEGELFCYSYSPVDHQYILNASMKAAKLLSQVYSIDGNTQLLDQASKAVKYVMDSQREDGSWAYAKHDHRSWADNYHTGYVIDCLDAYIKNTDDFSFQSNLEKGVEFYVNNFFTTEGVPKFYSNQTFPIDSTSAAQSLLTLSRFGYMKLAESVANWSINNMQHLNGGFYFRKHRNYLDKNIYMRWSNAWMFAGLAYFLFKKKGY